MRSSASKIHQSAQGCLVHNVIPNLTPPPGWVLQHVTPEYVHTEFGKVYDVDVHAQWRNGKGDKFELFIEIQKNILEKSFCEKCKVLTKMNLRNPRKIFIVIKEKNIPTDSMDMWEYLEQTIQVPW